MAWITISKPGAQTYTNVNAQGKQQYDQSSIEYDDPNVFYDGYNPNMWTDVPKPSGGSFTLRAGQATGLIMPPTYAREITINPNNWTKVPKPQ